MTGINYILLLMLFTLKMIFFFLEVFMSICFSCILYDLSYFVMLFFKEAVPSTTEGNIPGKQGETKSKSQMSETKSRKESQTDKKQSKKFKPHNTTDKAVKNSSDESNVAKNNSKKSKKKQYVLFVGNLPFSATKDDIMQHFNSTGNELQIRKQSSSSI